MSKPNDKVSAKVLVVIPVGPRCQPDFVADTIDSIRAFTPPGTKILLINDSGRTVSGDSTGPDVRVIESQAKGLLGALYLNLCQAFEYALLDDWDVLLRIDTDALVAGTFADRCAAYFRDNPDVGALGSFRRGWDGRSRSFAWSRRQILKTISVGIFYKPLTALSMGRTVRKAVRHGYELGESVMGGVVVYSRLAVETLSDLQMLPVKALASSGLQEDHLFGLSLAAAGLGQVDFGSKDDDLPFGVKHVGLAAHPSELLVRNKALIHSTRSFGDLTEAEIRAIFAESRSGSRLR